MHYARVHCCVKRMGLKLDGYVITWYHAQIYLLLWVTTWHLAICGICNHFLWLTYVEHFTHLEGRKWRGAGIGLPRFLKQDIDQTLALFWALFGIALQGSIGYQPCSGPHYNCYYVTTTITDLIVYIYHYYHYKLRLTQEPTEHCQPASTLLAKPQPPLLPRTLPNWQMVQRQPRRQWKLQCPLMGRRRSKRYKGV